MVNQHRTSLSLLALTASVLLVSACNDDVKYHDQDFDEVESPQLTPDAAVQYPVVPPAEPAYSGPVACKKVDVTDEHNQIPARSDTMVRSNASVPAGVTTDDLFEQFKAHCVGCHVDTDLGGFKVSRLNFASMDKRAQLNKALERIRSDDPKLIMPPPPIGKPYSSRPAGDPVKEFAEVLSQWLKAGAPDDVFYPVGKQEQVSNLYYLPKQVGENMTNLGNCIPDKRGFAAEKQKSAELDRLFEQATALPNRLDQTDLISWDSAELARYGVVAYAPTYTLWADNAKKVRMIRVPRGQSIRFDKDQQTFSIPPNTRFYKTFFKKVKDRQGNVKRWRKMETRLIVARPDDNTKDGLERHTALFGTYAWNEQETEAVLVRDPLRNGKPFRDRLVTYYTDEQRIDELVRTGNPKFKKVVEDEHLSRHYAIPGSERCIHCHMGSPSQSFILGFSPLQVHRRPMGVGGVIEPADPDELTQLQRLIDYGLITGMTSPDEVTLMENSQGTRKPRNEHELNAQGYIMGNCAHCHNPRGFPTWTAPELNSLLDFWPSKDGGIFQFPLDRVSPRNFRGFDQTTPQPYITPSLFDLPRGYEEQKNAVTDEILVSPKLQTCQRADGTYSTAAMLAPWRSLIYRNVESVFSYSEDYAIYPHMPRDTPGFDCRAKQLLGKWMVSIPAKMKEPAFEPFFTGKVPTTDAKVSSSYQWETAGSFSYGYFLRPGLSELPQPYEELVGDEPDSYNYVLAANDRVRLFVEHGDHSRNCPDEDQDIVDPKVLSGDPQYKLPQKRVDEEQVEGVKTPSSCEAFPETLMTGTENLVGVAFKLPHWFATDLTEAATTTWSPRRSDWHSVLVEGKVPRARDEDTPFLDEQRRRRQERKVIHQLTGVDPWRDTWEEDFPTAKAEKPLPITGDVRVTTALRKFALSDFKMGLWQEKPECSFPDIKRVSDIPKQDRPGWMDYVDYEVQPDSSPSLIAAAEDRHVYTVTPGGQVFTSICGNCHGPLADSRGRMADTIADLTGGDTRVANLRDGLFGSGGTNWSSVFKAESPPNVTTVAPSAEDWAARYMLWMGLGGTQRAIPGPALNVVANTRVLGVARRGLAGLGDVGANMLGLAEFVCRSIFNSASASNGMFDVARGRLSRENLYPRPSKAPPNVDKPGYELLPVLASNGDFDLWLHLCTLENPYPTVQIVNFGRQYSSNRNYLRTGFRRDLRQVPVDGQWVQDPRRFLTSRAAYATALIGDQEGRIQHGLTDDNLAPWCITRPETPEEDVQLVAAFKAERQARGLPVEPLEIPYCIQDPSGKAETIVPPESWARRGAMNAGLSVFVYLNALMRGETARQPGYDQCEELK